MKPIIADSKLVARCGLYCGACPAYLRERCKGCADGPMFASCPVRQCCVEHDYPTCADCKDFSNPRDCKKFNNFVSKLFGFIFRSDRAACVVQIKNVGLQEHAEIMAKSKIHTIKR